MAANMVHFGRRNLASRQFVHMHSVLQEQAAKPLRLAESAVGTGALHGMLDWDFLISR